MAQLLTAVSQGDENYTGMAARSTAVALQVRLSMIYRLFVWTILFLDHFDYFWAIKNQVSLFQSLDIFLWKTIINVIW